MREERTLRALYGAGAAGMVLFSLGPVAYMLAVAVSGTPEILSGPGDPAFSADAFRAVWGSGSLRFPEHLRNSLAVSGASALLCAGLASLAAYAVTRLPLPGRSAFLFLVLAASLFPPVSLVSYLFRLMESAGWINRYPALVLPYTAWILPLALWILTSYFSQVPRELDRAAQVDGCGTLRILFRVILPVAAPGIFSAALLSFIYAFNEFLFALMLTTDAAARTVPVAIAQFQGLHGEIPWGEVMAAAALATLPVVALTLLFQRRILAGLTRGAVKG